MKPSKIRKRSGNKGKKLRDYQERTKIAKSCKKLTEMYGGCGSDRGESSHMGEPEITDSVDIASEITDSVDLLENKITGGDDSLESGINNSVDLETNITDSVNLESNINDSANLEIGMSQPELDVGENSETGSITADILAQTPIDFSNKYPADPFYLQHKRIIPQLIRILFEIGTCQAGKDEHYIFPTS